MRSILVVLGLLIASSASADAATMHHSRTWHHLSPSESFNFAPSWGYERTAPSVHYEYSPPAYNDPGPNNLGGLVGGNPNGG